MTSRVNPHWPLAALAFVLFFLAAPALHAAEPRAHGMILDDKNRLQVLEEDGFLVIKLQMKDRAPGGEKVFKDPDSGEVQDVIRVGDEKVLARIRSEVIEAAPPNYISNPGQRYRITVQGVKVAPEYSHIFEVDAADALKAVYNEFGRLASDAHGIERDALYFGAVLSTQILNESGNLPADLPITLVRSKVGQFRIQGQYMSRGKQPRVNRFMTASTGGKYTDVQKYQADIAEPDMEAINGPNYKRGLPEQINRSNPYVPKKYRPAQKPTRELTIGRANQMHLEQLKEQIDEKKRVQHRKYGMPEKNMSLPKYNYPTVTLSRRQKRDFLLGKNQSPSELLAERQGKIPPAPYNPSKRYGSQEQAGTASQKAGYQQQHTGYPQQQGNHQQQH